MNVLDLLAQASHTLKLLLSLSHSNALVVALLAHIIKNSFNSAYSIGSIATGMLGSQLMYVCRRCTVSSIPPVVYMCVFLRCLAKIFSSESSHACGD